MALRFLCQPDSVLHCESLHAQWKWLEHDRRGIPFKMRNAILRLQQYLRHSNNTFPSGEVLEPFVQEVRADLAAKLERLRQAGELPPGPCEP